MSTVAEKLSPPSLARPRYEYEVPEPAREWDTDPRWNDDLED